MSASAAAEFPSDLTAFRARAEMLVDRAIHQKGEVPAKHTGYMSTGPRISFEDSLLPELWEGFVTDATAMVDEEIVEPSEIGALARGQQILRAAQAYRNQAQST